MKRVVVVAMGHTRDDAIAAALRVLTLAVNNRKSKSLSVGGTSGNANMEISKG